MQSNEPFCRYKMWLHATHWSLIATAPSSAMAAATSAHQGRHRAMHGFAVGDLQQLLSMCLASICPWSSFSCQLLNFTQAATQIAAHPLSAWLVCCSCQATHIRMAFAVFLVCECAFLNKGEAMISFHKIHLIF